MMNQLIAEMESRGPQYTPLIMALCILGRRAGRMRLMSFPTVIAHIETFMREELAVTGKNHAPSLKMAANWEAEYPYLPERVVSKFPDAESKLPPWATDQLDWGAMKRDAMMSQAPRTEYAHTTVGNSASSQVDSEGQGWGTGILAGGIVSGIVSGILIWGFSTRNRAVERPARTSKPSPSRHMSIVGRRDKYMSK